MNLLLVVDAQNDFCENGGLPVTGGNAVCALIADHITTRRDRYTAGVAASFDWHIDPGTHFAAPSQDPDYAHTWPVHCPAGSVGAQINPALRDVTFDATITKGLYEAAFSPFDGRVADFTDTLSTWKERPDFANWLRERDVTSIDVCGIATDYCVRAACLDAVASGLRVRLLVDLTAGVATDSTRATLLELRAAGVELVAATAAAAVAPAVTEALSDDLALTAA